MNGCCVKERLRRGEVISYRWEVWIWGWWIVVGFWLVGG